MENLVKNITKKCLIFLVVMVNLTMNVSVIFSIFTEPIERWTKQTGTTGSDFGCSVAVDSSNNVYITGSANGGLDGNTAFGESDMVLIKYNNNGGREWTKQIGTIRDDSGQKVALDSSGNIYVAGYTGGGLDGNINTDGYDIFLVKYDSSGNKQWLRQMGTGNYNLVHGLGVDTSGYIYITGETDDGLDGNTNAGDRDIFLVKYDPNGVKQWTKQLGTSGNDSGQSLDIDNLGNIYITGYTAGNLDGNTNAGDRDIFLVKYDSNGNKQWTKQLGTSNYDGARGLIIDTSGYIYITGETTGGLDGNTTAGGYDIFLVKYDSSGVKQWTKQLGTSSYDYGHGVVVDGSGNIYVTGYTGGGLDGNINIGGSDIFLTKYNSDDNKQWTKQIGSDADDIVNEGIVVDNSKSIYITGSTRGGLDGNANAGIYDIFLIKYETNIQPLLNWTGETGYVSDGVNPETGDATTTFNFRVKYSDEDNDAPKSGYPKLHIKKGGTEILYSPFTMIKVTDNYTTGAIYSYSATLSTGTDYTYYFEAYDVLGATATGVLTSPVDAPDVIIPTSIADHYEITIPTSNVIAGNSFTITITAKNSNNNTITNYFGSVSIQAVLASDTTQAGSRILGVTNATLVNGTVTVSNQTYTKGENIKIKVTDSNNISSFSNTVTMLPSSDITMSITANPVSVVNNQPAQITITITDYYNNPVANQIVSFIVSKGSGTLSSSSNITDSLGRVTITFIPAFSGLTSGSCIIRAESGALRETVTISVAVLLDANGGIVVAADDPETKIVIPAGVLPNNTVVNINKQSANYGEGQQYEITAKNQNTNEDIRNLDVPVTVTLHYEVSAGNVANTNVSVNEVSDKLAVYYNDGVNWQKIGGTVNTINQTVTAKTTHLSSYALRETAKASAFKFGGIGPNPFSPNPDGINDRVYFYFDNPENKSGEIKISDLEGSLIRNIPIEEGVVPYWNGRNNSGNLVDTGVYYYWLRIGDKVINGTIVLGK